MRIQLKIITDFGIFTGPPFDVTDDQFEILKHKSSSYYDEGGFEMIGEDGGLVIISPEVVKKSILKIDVIKDVQE